MRCIQAEVFVGIYWQQYGWVAPGEEVSGLEDEHLLSGDKPKLIYMKAAAERQPRLTEMLARVETDDRASYKRFDTADDLAELLADDMAVLLTERFARPVPAAALGRRPVPLPAPPFSASGRRAPARCSICLSTGFRVGGCWLVLDNVEQLVAAASDLGILLAACPDLTVLVTSRIVLRLRGEHEVALAPLPTPSADPRADAETIGRSASVRLLVARARQVRADFTVTSATPPRWPSCAAGLTVFRWPWSWPPPSCGC